MIDPGKRQSVQFLIGDMSEILVFPDTGFISDDHLGNAMLLAIVGNIPRNLMKIVRYRVAFLFIKSLDMFG